MKFFQIQLRPPSLIWPLALTQKLYYGISSMYLSFIHPLRLLSFKKFLFIFNLKFSFNYLIEYLIELNILFIYIYYINIYLYKLNINWIKYLIELKI